MSTEPMLVEAFPSAFEVAILRLPAGAVARVHHPLGVKDYRPLLVEDATYVAIPGMAEVIGWGAVCWHYTLRGVRNGRHRLDRAAWHDAAALLAGAAPVVYVAYEKRDYYGQERWTAVEASPESVAARLAEKAGVAS